MRAQLEDPNKVLVDIGAGYYIEMSADRAVDHYTRKVNSLTTEIDSLKAVIISKAAIRDQIVHALQQKIQLLTAQQAPQK